MVEQPIEKEHTSRFERDRDDALAVHLCVADLPVSPLEMDHRTLAMASGDNMHTPVFWCGLVKRDPDTNDRCAQRKVKEGMVLMPWLLPPYQRRFEQGLVLPQSRLLIQQLSNDREQAGVLSNRTQSRLVSHVPRQFPHEILALLWGQRRNNIPRGRLEGTTPRNRGSAATASAGLGGCLGGRPRRFGATQTGGGP